MIRILVCDDCIEDLEHIISALNNCGYEQNMSITGFSKPSDALGFIAEGGVCDIAFLDIIMPEMTGVELAEKMRADGFDGFIVFLTSVNDFASQSYKVKAFSYLLKPADEAEIKEILEAIAKSKNQTQASGFTVKRKNGSRFVAFSELVYVEVRNHNLYFYLSGGEVVEAYAPLREYADTLLAEPCMAQHHRSYLINMDYVSACENGFAVLWDGTKISAPQNFSELQSKCLKWKFGRK